MFSAKTGYGPGQQDWGFVDVRKGAHMFYWLYYTTADVANYTQRPLAIWLQGGPGASSTGYGNFEELGPVDIYGNYRNWTWVKDMNVLFIDNPVGSGFSYADNILQLTSNNKQIALDLVEFMKGFYSIHPEFETVPLHIFCESYGGKMAPEFALELYYAIQRKEIKSNLTSVALGDPWTSPIDSVLAWAPLLLNMVKKSRNSKSFNKYFKYFFSFSRELLIKMVMKILWLLPTKRCNWLKKRNGPRPLCNGVLHNLYC